VYNSLPENALLSELPGSKHHTIRVHDKQKTSLILVPNTNHTRPLLYILQYNQLCNVKIMHLLCIPVNLSRIQSINCIVIMLFSILIILLLKLFIIKQT